MIDMVARHLRGDPRAHGIERVVLSGGVFQNELLLRGCHGALGGAGFRVHSHRLVPANDGGVGVGAGGGGGLGRAVSAVASRDGGVALGQAAAGWGAR